MGAKSKLDSRLSSNSKQTNKAEQVKSDAVGAGSDDDSANDSSTKSVLSGCINDGNVCYLNSHMQLFSQIFNALKILQSWKATECEQRLRQKLEVSRAKIRDGLKDHFKVAEQMMEILKNSTEDNSSIIFKELSKRKQTMEDEILFHNREMNECASKIENLSLFQELLEKTVQVCQRHNTVNATNVHHNISKLSNNPSYPMTDSEQNDVREIFDSFIHFDHMLYLDILLSLLVEDYSNIRCHGCKQVFTTKEKLPYVPLKDDKNSNNHSISDLVDYYQKPEEMKNENKYYCHTCKSKQNATKWQDINALGNSLLLIAPRINAYRRRNKKIYSINQEIEIKNSIYDLNTNLNHYGHSIRS